MRASREDLRAELRAMARADQDTDDRAGRSATSSPELRVARLREIIREYGWPGNSLVGRDGARAAWLIAQHADFDVPFQRACLTLVEAAYYNSDLDGHDLAYLSDRLAKAEGRAQLYGTQGATAYTADEEAVVDARRRSLGLPALSEFRAMVARGEYARIHEPGW